MLACRASRFDFLSSFLRKRYKLVIVAWIIGLVVFGTQIPTFFGAVSYNVAGSNFGGPDRTPSPSRRRTSSPRSFRPRTTTGGNGIILVLQNQQMYSSSVAVRAPRPERDRSPRTPRSRGASPGWTASTRRSIRSSSRSSRPSCRRSPSSTRASASDANGTCRLLPQSTWDVASSIVANATAASFASSPLFTARASSLASFLLLLQHGLQPVAGQGGDREPSSPNESYLQYPLVLSRLDHEEPRQPRQRDDDRGLQLRGPADRQDDRRLQGRRLGLERPVARDVLRHGRRRCSPLTSRRSSVR